MRKRWVATVLIMLLAISSAGPAHAQPDWPGKHAITFVVPFAPGGGGDVIARLIALKMGPTLKQSIVVLNKPGAAGQIGEGFVAHSASDGYTVLFDASPFVANKFLYPNLEFDLQTAFAPIGVVAKFPLIAVVTPSFAAKSIQELVALAAAQPGAIFFASIGIGSVQDLAGRMFMRRAGVQMGNIPYKGGGPAMVDVMGGQVPLLFGNGASALPAVRAGTLRALAVTGQTRLEALPDIPTLEELGIKGMDLYEWNGMFVPAKTPADIVARLSDALDAALSNPDVQRTITDLGGQRLPGGRAGAVSFLAEQARAVNEIIQADDIHPD